MDHFLSGFIGQCRISLPELNLSKDHRMNMAPLNFSRRDALQSMSAGFGFMAFAGMSTMAGPAFKNPLASKDPHFKPRAKRIIFACMRGGPSHVDTFDYKPALAKDNGKSAQGFGNRKLLESPWKFSKRGKSGIEISDLYPNLAKHADKMCLVNSMYGDIPNHPQCFVQLHTGSFQFVRPSLGSWVLYGLGTENQNLPGFVTQAETLKAQGVDTIICTAVNDVFVMDAWGKSANADGKVLMAADGNGDFVSSLGLELDASGFGMGKRGQRFSVVVDNGVATHVNIEGPGEFTVSNAETAVNQTA